MKSTPPPSPEETALAERERLVKSQTEHNIVPGIQHAIIDAGSVDVVCSGVTDTLLKSEPVDSSKIFMAYSCTKIVTAICILQLCDQGKLKLQDPLQQHYPDHPYGDKVTIQSLLNHTSGVPSPMPVDWFVTATEDLDSTQKLQEIMTKNNQLKFEPGTKRLYGNLGYWLLENCIERVSQMSYSDYVQQHIMDPLGIPKDQATFDLLPSKQFDNNSKLATGHIQKWSLANALFYLLSPKNYWIQPSDDNRWSRFAGLRHFGQAYGGLYCNVSCLAEILKDLLESEKSILLSKEIKQRMFQEDSIAKNATIGGWVIGTLNGVTYYGKQGGGFGFHGNIRLYPSIGIATAFLANSTEVSEGPIDARANILDAPIVDSKVSSSRISKVGSVSS